MAEILKQRVVAAPANVVEATIRSPGGWLRQAVDEAGRTGRAAVATLEADLGRGGTAVHVAARAQVEVGDAHHVRSRIVIPLTWQAARAAAWFPVMDAILELHPAGRGRTRVVFWGRYDPPLGRIGDILDRLVAHGIADATVDHLLEAIATRAEAGAKAARSVR